MSETKARTGKIEAKCQLCGYESEVEIKGRILRPLRCPKCGGFMVLLLEEFVPNGGFYNG